MSYVDQFGSRIIPTRRRYAFGLGTKKRPVNVMMDGTGNLFIRFADSLDYVAVADLAGDFVRIDAMNRELTPRDVALVKV